jgi:uncharacterized damage-inducible protein DinB
MNIIIPFYQHQLKEEAVITRKFLKIIPNDKLEWQAHPKSMTLKRLAAHLAELPGWIPMAIATDMLDFSTGDYSPAPMNNNEELLTIFEENQKKAEEALSKANDSILQNPWTMKNGDEIFFTITKQEVIRMAVSQTIHHRAQMGVYLRLLNIPIPGSYGPSADELGL